MSISPEPSKHQPVPAKKEIKTEECYEFLQKVEVEETPGLEHGGTTEILAFQSFNVKEEKLSPVQVKEEEESNLKEYGHYNSSPSGHEVDERPELEHEWTTEMPTSAQLPCEEEAYCAVEIKEEIKEEDCHEDISITIQEEKSGIEHNWNTVTSPQLSCKEEVEEDTYVPVEIKQEEIEDEHFREYGYDSPCKSHWKFKELSEDLKKRIVALHEDGLGYKRIGRALRLSCSTVAKIMQRFKRNGSVQNKPRHGRPKKLSERALRHIQRMSSRRMSAASIAAEVEAVGGQPVSVQTIRRKLHQIGLLSSQKEASSKELQGDIEGTGDKDRRPTLDPCEAAQCSVTSPQQLHQPSDPAEKKHECSQCLKTFAGPSPLAYHQRIHTGEKPHRCLTCGKCFRSRLQLDIHQVTHTREKPHRCSECGKAFGQASHLKAHQMIHTGERPHRCPQCGKAFRQASDLKKHLRFHAGEKPHQCSQCGRAFTQVSCLRTHQRTHTGAKPHRCPECGKAFGEISGLRKHRIVHTEDKPYACALCGKRFRRNADLKTHQLVHSNDKPHVCSLCGKAFSQRVNLTRHQLQIHQRSNTADKTQKCPQ